MQQAGSISVIIPLYNAAAYIGRALDSVLAQSFTDFEVLVVDDGSTDDGPEKVLATGDPRIRLVRQANAGPGAARNRGAAESTGELLAFLDADDDWTPDYLQTIWEAFEAHPECRASVCAVSGFELKARNDVYRCFPACRGTWRMPVYRELPEFNLAILAFTTSAFVCRREAYEKYRGFYAENHSTWGEDQYLWILFLLNDVVYYDVTERVNYHLLDTGLSRSQTERPPKAAVLAPGWLREHCPPEYRTLLERYLFRETMSQILQYVGRDELAEAGALRRKYAESSPWEYLPLSSRLIFQLGGLFPKTVRLANRLRRWVFRS